MIIVCHGYRHDGSRESLVASDCRLRLSSPEPKEIEEVERKRSKMRALSNQVVRNIYAEFIKFINSQAAEFPRQ